MVKQSLHMGEKLPSFDARNFSLTKIASDGNSVFPIFFSFQNRSLRGQEEND